MLAYFPLTVGAGLYFRRNYQTHKRLMLLSGLVMFGPLVTRYTVMFSIASLPSYFLYAVRPHALLLALAIYDIASRKRPHWVTVCGIVWAVSQRQITTWIVGTAPANAYVEWLRRLV